MILDRARWLPLVAWLLAIPHFVILKGLFNTQWVRWSPIGTFSIAFPVCVTSAGIVVIAIQLVITGRHPRGLYDLFTGVARWWFRAVAFLTILTALYPPLRLDQGEAEPGVPVGTAVGSDVAARDGMNHTGMRGDRPDDVVSIGTGIGHPDGAA
jgi:Domain of unknown function (DUF4389)